MGVRVLLSGRELGLLVGSVFLAGANPLRAGDGSRLAKPPRSGARKGGLEAAAGSGIMTAEEDGTVQHRLCGRVSLAGSGELWHGGRARRPGPPQGRRPSAIAGPGAAQRRRGRLIKYGLIRQHSGQAGSRRDELHEASGWPPQILPARI